MTGSSPSQPNTTSNSTTHRNLEIQSVMVQGSCPILLVAPQRKLSLKIRPASGNLVAAVWTTAFGQSVLQNLVPGSLNENMPAGWTKRISTVTPDIPFVYVVQPNLASDLSSSVQGLRRGVGLISQFEVRMKSGEMQGNLRAEVLDHPFRELPNLFWIII